MTTMRIFGPWRLRERASWRSTKLSARGTYRARPTSSGLCTTRLKEDGYVSLEVDPHLAHDTRGTVDEARRLWAALSRPNVFIKVPATAEGLPAIQQLISEGINVNVTLLFGLPRYRQVVEAYLAGLEARLIQAKPVKTVASVASFFVSRIDALVDPLLEETRRSRRCGGGVGKECMGQVAIASAKVAYQIYKEVFDSDSLHETGRQRSPYPAAAVGKHQHEEPGLQRREICRSAHRTRHHQHGAGRDPRRLPRPRRPEGPHRRRGREGPGGCWTYCRTWASTSTK